MEIFIAVQKQVSFFQILNFRHHSFIDLTIGKEHTLNRVLNRFGSNCTYIVVGKGSDEQQLSQKVSEKIRIFHI